MRSVGGSPRGRVRGQGWELVWLGGGCIDPHLTAVRQGRCGGRFPRGRGEGREFFGGGRGIEHLWGCTTQQTDTVYRVAQYVCACIMLAPRPACTLNTCLCLPVFLPAWSYLPACLPGATRPQFERTLIVCEDDAYVSYLEGCTAPAYDSNQLHAAVVELSCGANAEIKYSTVQNW